MNVELLDRAMLRVREAAKVGLWDQSYFEDEKACGTSHCIGGFVVLDHDGFVPLGCAERAQELLGITDAEADQLFFFTTNIRNVKQLQSVVDALKAKYAER